MSSASLDPQNRRRKPVTILQKRTGSDISPIIQDPNCCLRPMSRLGTISLPHDRVITFFPILWARLYREFCRRKSMSTRTLAGM